MNSMMARPKKVVEEKTDVSVVEEKALPTIHDVEWTDHVLSFLTEDEKIMGNPTTDGLRRIFERVMDCQILEADSKVVQTPSPDNEKRATVEFALTFKPNWVGDGFNETRRVSGSADVYWGNCDKVFRNHPVAVAETRAEGRALRRALRLRKVVAAEEIAENVEDNPDHSNATKIAINQMNFIDTLGKRLDIDIGKLLENLSIKYENVYDIEHSEAVTLIRKLSYYQQHLEEISSDIMGYNSNWR